MNRVSPRAGYYVISVGIVLQFLGLAIDAWMHGRNPELASQESILSLDNPSHALLAVGMGLTVAGAVLGLCAFLAPATLSALRPLVPALPPLVLAVFTIGSVVFAYQVGGFSPHGHIESTAVTDDHNAGGSHNESVRAAPTAGDVLAAGDAAHNGSGASDAHVHAPAADGHGAPAGQDGQAGVAPSLVVLPTPLCPPGSLWHPEMGHCMGLVPTDAPTPGCPPGYVWHPQMGHCMPLTPTPTLGPTGTPTPACPEGFFWHPAMGHCMPVAGTPPSITPPSGTPLPTIVCPTGYVWSPEAGDCIATPPTPTAIP